MQVQLNSGERIDDLIINDYKIIQSTQAFRFSLDAVLLAHFAYIRRQAIAVDLGTGSGVIALLLAARNIKSVIGIEIDPLLADMASRSVTLNEVGSIVSIINADMRRLQGVLPAGKYDLVVSNPPYRRSGTGKISKNDKIINSRHEISVSLAEVIAAAKYLLKYRGRLALIHLPERLPEIFYQMHMQGIEPKRMRIVHSYVDRKACLAMIEGILGGKSGLEIMPPLVIYQQNGIYNDEIQKYYIKHSDDGSR